eukprot:CAMPEP_0176168186 /NCGR_PEP_ID=MMETSP0120_2-20121206/86071_1 /TAXON_ID=160619 /ORGANISM="Kryptoperidinium foliaceum, Strain CCMP 1326" /LENGTH=314 /DNA_ID=CAMNT_0017505875 /DNA_START=59 /DNA_END=1003 /DNA_ORIENTATION=-
MGRKREAKRKILDELGRSRKAAKDLERIIKAKTPGLEKYVKKSLKKLVKKGKVEKYGDEYQVVLQKQEENGETTVPDEDTNDNDEDALPIALRLRKEKSVVEKKSVKFVEEEVDLDEEIRRLEEELNRQSSSDEMSDDDSTNDERSQEAKVLSLSAYADDRIGHLPDQYLPEPGKYKPQGPNEKPGKKKEKGRKEDESKKTDGLKEAVQEVLNGYKARSSERLPFYCRFCSKQYNNETEFFEHKITEFHKTAVEMERKATYCRLCLKQLTSPEQMKEHLSSRPHKERLQAVRNRQRSDKKAGKDRRGRSGRQWS